MRTTLLALSLSAMALSGCRAPMPNWDFSAPFGPRKVPPPGTGALGQPANGAPYYNPAQQVGQAPGPAPAGANISMNAPPPVQPAFAQIPASGGYVPAGVGPIASPAVATNPLLQGMPVNQPLPAGPGVTNGLRGMPGSHPTLNAAPNGAGSTFEPLPAPGAEAGWRSMGEPATSHSAGVRVGGIAESVASVSPQGAKGQWSFQSLPRSGVALPVSDSKGLVPARLLGGSTDGPRTAATNRISGAELALDGAAAIDREVARFARMD